MRCLEGMEIVGQNPQDFDPLGRAMGEASAVSKVDDE